MREISGPIFSIETLSNDLIALGLKQGMSIIVHSSFKALGHVIGGPVSVILALENILTENGSILMPTFTESLCDPSTEENYYPERYWPAVRDQLPIFKADLTPTDRSIGIIPEIFRKQDGTVRSSHPHLSFAAWGSQKHLLVDNHSFNFALGEGSPLARLYDLRGYVLLLGAPLDANTSLHLSEYRLSDSKKKSKQWDVCLLQEGKRIWTHYDDIENECSDFPVILNDYIKKNLPHSKGIVGNSDSYLLPQRSLVDFGTVWMMENR